MMGLTRPIAIKRTTTVLHSRDADGPLRSMGMASDDHDEYDRALKGRWDERERRVGVVAVLLS